MKAIAALQDIASADNAMDGRTQ